MARPFGKILVALSFCVLQFAAASSNAVPIIWNLSGTFNDGGTASGSFLYDASSNSMSSIDITTTAGSAFGGATYHAPFSFNASSMPFVPGFVPDFTGTPLLSLFYASALTNAGGTVGATSSSSESTCTNADCSSSVPVRSLTSGSLSATVPLRFVLQGVTFGDGGTASGSFLYYPGTTQYGGVNIKTTGGSAFGGTEYVQVQPGSDGIDLNAIGDLHIAFNNSDTDTTAYVLHVDLRLPSNSNLERLFISDGSESQCTDATCSSSSPLRDVTGGSVAVPAPSSLALGLLGVLALFAARRRSERPVTA